jgi:hypothetical protein
MMEQAHDPDQQIAERYFLDELTTAEAEAFEVHYFDCASCAEYVREEQMLFDLGRKIARETQDAGDFPARLHPVATPDSAPLPASSAPLPAPLPWPSWRQWVPAAAAAMLVIVVLGPFTRRPEPRPFVYSPNQVMVEFSPNRAQAAEAPIFRFGEPISLSVIAPPDTEAGDRAVVRTADTQELIPGGRELAQADISEPFVLQPSALPAGRYEVVIERADGNRRTRIAALPFEVRK